MADITNLDSFLGDVADAIRAKRGTTEQIPAENFDTEINNIVTGTVVEKAVVEAANVVEEETVVKIDSAPIGECVVIPENGITEVVADKALLAENVGITPEKIVQGCQVLGIEGSGEGGGITINDANATPDDVLAPKIFYNNDGKQFGRIQTMYSNVGNVTNVENSNLSYACDVRQDLGYFLKVVSNTVRVYSLETGEVVQTLNSSSQLSGRQMFDAKFSRKPAEGENVYNIITMAAGLNGSTCTVDIDVTRFDINDPTTAKEYFGCSTNNGGSNGGRYGSYGFTIVENDNYVYSTVKAYSNYYQSWTGNNNLYYINNEAKTITNRCEFGGIGAAGLVPQMTDDHKIILTNCPNHLQLARINDSNNGISSITSYNPSSESAPRLVLTDSGYFYLDKGYYNTNMELLHQYDSLPWEWSDTVLWCNGYLVRFNSTSTITVYSFDKDTFKISVARTFEINGVPNRGYYNTGVSSHYVMTLNNYPEANGNTIAFSTNNGVYYMLYLDVENLKLEGVEIKGVGYYDTSAITTSGDKLLEGEVMFTSKGKTIGTMPNNGNLSYQPSTDIQTIPSGYTSGGTISPVTSAIDNNINPDNIKKGVTILDIEGTYEPEGGDATSDANIQAKYLLEGYSVVSDGKLIEGTMKNYGDTEINYTSEVQEIPSGYYNSLIIPESVSTNLDGYIECNDALDYALNGKLISWTELNYIRSSSGQFIDTGIKCNDRLKIQAKFSIHASLAHVYFGNLGAGESDTLRFFSAPNPDLWYLDYGSGENLNRISGGSPVLDTIYNFEIGNRYIKDLDTNTDIVSSTSVSFTEKSYNIHIGGDDSEFSIYYCKIYNGNTLVRDLVPAMMNSDGTIGLYDKVSRNFFGNSGSGKFISGGVKE